MGSLGTRVVLDCQTAWKRGGFSPPKCGHHWRHCIPVHHLVHHYIHVLASLRFTRAFLHLSSIKADAHTSLRLTLKFHADDLWTFASAPLYECAMHSLSLLSRFRRLALISSQITGVRRRIRCYERAFRCTFMFKKRTHRAQIESPGSLDLFRWRHFCGRLIEHRAGHKRSSVLGRVAVTSGFKADDPSRECRAVSSQRRLLRIYTLGCAFQFLSSALTLRERALRYSTLGDSRRLIGPGEMHSRIGVETASGRPTDRPKNN